MSARNRPFDIGIYIPHFEHPWSGRTISWREIHDIAQRVEQVGFDSVWLPDHLIFRFPNVNPQGAWDVWSLLSALAATTSKVQIAPLVACASFRNPALIAKMADTIEEISGGRFILGLGAGWHEPEYTAYGFPYDHRVSRFEEAIQIISSLLRTGYVDFEGQYYSARDCELRPRGPRPEGPPIIIGSNGPRMMNIMARHADGWNADRRNDVEWAVRMQDKIDAACVEAGRDPATLTRTIGIQVDVLNDKRDPTQPRQYVATPFPIAGSSEEIAARIREYVRARIDHMQIWLDPPSVEAVEALAPVLEILDSETVS
jgi:alkanesulfonate monooxygenase SsuD/methylene tetrahydromethanopterin reductase-like flavin-dependent oxidoreductase (luciferase family)